MDVVVMWEHAYFKRTCFIAFTLTFHKFISYSSTGAMPALHLLVMTDQYPIPNLLVVFFLQYCLMFFSSLLERTYRQKTSYSNSNRTNNSTDHKPQTQLGLTTVKLCLMSAVFHKAYNDQQHQFGPEVFCSEITWLVTLRRCNVTCCESISGLEAYDWHCSVLGRFHPFHRPQRPLG